ncbi:MAG: DUF2283 domain-containing protein [Thermoplasmataceae archaeon]
MRKYTLEYDSEVDSAYIKISSGKVEESSEINEDIIIDLDKNQHLVGIEILRFSKSKFDLRALISQDMGNVVSLVK